MPALRMSGALTAHAAFVSGTTRLLLVGAIIVAVGSAAAFAFIRSRDLAHVPAPEAAPAAEPAR